MKKSKRLTPEAAVKMLIDAEKRGLFTHEIRSAIGTVIRELHVQQERLDEATRGLKHYQGLVKKVKKHGSISIQTLLRDSNASRMGSNG